MIQQLIGYLTQGQIDEILNIIMTQYRLFCHFIETADYRNLFAEEYAPHKRMHGVSWAIASGFSSNTDIIEGITISRKEYGKGHTRPELKNDRIVIHILNKTTHFHAEYLNEYYRMNNFEGQIEKMYCYFKFSVDHRKLKQVSLCLPDINGAVLVEDILLSTPEINRLIF